MATTLSYRPGAGGSLHDRQPSISSLAESRKSSNLSSTASHHKHSSQTSLIPRSPQAASRKSTRPTSPTQNNVTYHRSTRLRAQYPLNSRESHVEYILVASFDIDRGPVMEHQYPGAISPDESMLAELMLPDQTHVRQQDWTIFFLHKDANVDGEEAEEKETRRSERRKRRADREEALLKGEAQEDEVVSEDTDSEDDDDHDDRDGPPLMYVLNLVNTKQDSTVKRGAVVKAMAICTRHSFLHIYKPLLLLALEDYFKSPFPETLQALYNAVNAMDLSMMPRLSLLERHILQASDTKDMFVEKFESMIQQRLAREAATGKAASSPSSPTKSDPQYTIPRDTHEFESRVVYNDIPIPIKVPTAVSPETVGDFSLIKLIQIFGGPHATQPQPFALHPHLTTSGAFTHPIIVLINALLTQKRVIFLGHNRPSGEVAEAVLAAAALASGGVLRGFSRYAFPYTDLTKIDDLLKVPGFIAGVTNPAFSHHPEWWDLLCDLPTGRMKISSSIEAAPITDGAAHFQQHGHSLPAGSDPTGDTAFIEDVNRSIASRHGETTIRDKFRAYITRFTRIAAAFEEVVYGASPLYVITPAEGDNLDSPIARTAPTTNGAATNDRTALPKGHGYVWSSEELKNRELAASAARIEGWRNTRSYYTFISDLATREATVPKPPTTPVDAKTPSGSIVKPKPRFDLYHALSRLRALKLTSLEAGAIYLALSAYCTDYDSILELLELTPMAEAGLFYVTLGLWHEDRRVRQGTVELLDRIRKHECGRHFYARVGGFVNMGFNRCWREREAGIGEEAEDDADLLAGNGFSVGRAS